MTIPLYLAMTPSEITALPVPEFPVAWMGFHFSPDNPGLSNLPDHLPSGSMLTVNDSLPIGAHDPKLIAKQLTDAVIKLSCDGVVLDFQRQWNEKTAVLIRHLSKAVSFPMAVSELYAKDTDCPIFLSPVPSDRQLSDHLNPWQGREIWLDLGPGYQTVTITESGAYCAPSFADHSRKDFFQDRKLHNHYHIEINDSICFHIFRTSDDMKSLLLEAEGSNVTKAVGLYQEWKKSSG